MYSYIKKVTLFFWSANLYNNKVDFDLHSGIHKLPFKPVTMVIQHTVLLGLYGKLFHSYQFSSLVRFKTTSLNWISLVMKIDIRGIISHTTLVGMLYYYNTVFFSDRMGLKWLSSQVWLTPTLAFVFVPWSTGVYVPVPELRRLDLITGATAVHFKWEDF